MHLTIRECTMDDLSTLRKISIDTFDDTFRHLNTPANMEVYLNQAFDIEKLRDELSNSNSFFYFLYADEELSGYLKLNEHEAQTDINDPRSLEIERIYVKRQVQGKGLGGFQLNRAIDIASSRSKAYIWLGVWEKNEKAIQFYKKNGFYEIGRHFFLMGDEEQRDFVMRKTLSPGFLPVPR